MSLISGVPVEDFPTSSCSNSVMSSVDRPMSAPSGPTQPRHQETISPKANPTSAQCQRLKFSIRIMRGSFRHRERQKRRIIFRRAAEDYQENRDFKDYFKLPNEAIWPVIRHSPDWAESPASRPVRWARMTYS